MVIRALGESAEAKKQPNVQPGLSIPYQEIILLLKRMAELDVVEADFQAGPMTDAGAFLENLPANDR